MLPICFFTASLSETHYSVSPPSLLYKAMATQGCFFISRESLEQLCQEMCRCPAIYWYNLCVHFMLFLFDFTFCLNLELMAENKSLNVSFLSAARPPSADSSAQAEIIELKTELVVAEKAAGSLEESLAAVEAVNSTLKERLAEAEGGRDELEERLQEIESERDESVTAHQQTQLQLMQVTVSKDTVKIRVNLPELSVSRISDCNHIRLY